MALIVLRPWMHRREDETELERCHRLAHSCAGCGHWEASLPVLDAHEDNCTQLSRSAKNTTDA